MQEINMPDVNQGANLQHVYDWTYDGGSYGRQPTIDDLITKGWMPLLEGRLVYWDTTNKDLRVTAMFRQLITEEYSQDISTQALLIRYLSRGACHPRVSSSVDTYETSDRSSKSQRRILNIPVTLDGSGEEIAELLMAISDYYGVIEIKGIISDFTDAAVSFQFKEGAVNLGMPVDGEASLNLTENVMNTQLTGLVLWNGTDNTALNCSITGGAAGGKLVFQIEGWYET